MADLLLADWLSSQDIERKALPMPGVFSAESPSPGFGGGAGH